MNKQITPNEFTKQVNAFRISRVILTAYELKIFSVINERRKTAEEVARIINADVRATDRLMNALVSIKLLDKSEGLFSNSEFSLKYLVEGKNTYMSGLMHNVNLWNNWSTMTEAVKKGTTVTMKKPVNERQSEWLESFIAAMHSRGKKQALEIVKLINLKNVNTVLDVGGGSGLYSFALVDNKPELKATVFDLPNVIPITQKYIQQEGYKDSVNTVAGDFLKDDFGSGYDMVFLSAIIHMNTPEQNKLLIEKSFKALNLNGQLVILDYIMNEDRTQPITGALFALNMLVGTSAGDTYTEYEVTSWLRETGFTNITKIDTEYNTGIVTGIKPKD
jgi:ubiquinone/menaquinone biosynthesis C-methylase UbiE